MGLAAIILAIIFVVTPFLVIRENRTNDRECNETYGHEWKSEITSGIIFTTDSCINQETGEIRKQP